MLYEVITQDSIRLLEREPDFAMGQVFNAYINLWGTDRDDWIWAQQALEALA